MRIEKMLVAIDDSAPALAGATVAVEIARSLAAEIRFVCVVEPGRDADAILRHVAAIAEVEGVRADAQTLFDGSHPYEALLDAAAAWPADLIVMGRSDSGPRGRPHVGSQTEHVLEFTEIPVLVVPEPDARRHGRRR
jgi:nucleotide-binding universal stress UspA family protein